MSQNEIITTIEELQELRRMQEELEAEITSLQDKVKEHMQEISEDYFEKYDPNDKEGKFAIVYEFRRRRAFSRILCDLLHQIEGELPSSDWASRLKAEEGGAAV